MDPTIKNNPRVIAVKERSVGNADHGQSWLDTKSFPLNATLREVLEWADNDPRLYKYCDATKNGRLMLCIDETDQPGRPEEYPR